MSETAQSESGKPETLRPMPFKEEMAMKARNKTRDESVQLSPDRFHEADFRRVVWGSYVEPNTTLEQLLKPEFWAHIAGKLKQYDQIEVKWDDGSHYATFLVIDAGPSWAQVFKLTFVDLGGKNIPAAPEFPFEVKWGGGHHKFRIIRKADQAVIQSGLATKDIAEQAMKEYAKTVQAM